MIRKVGISLSHGGLERLKLAPILLIAAIALAALLFQGSSSAFIWALPLVYYLSRRISGVRGLNRGLWFAAGLCIVVTSVLSFPFTRKAVAGYYLSLAEQAYVQGNNGQWHVALISAGKWYANHPILLYAQYRVSLEDGEKSRKDDLLLKAVDEGLEDPDGLYEAARVLAKRGERAKEIALYRRILRLRPEHPEANYCLAMYYDQEQHDRPKAVHHLRIARDNLPEGNVWRARCEELLREFGQEP